MNSLLEFPSVKPDPQLGLSLDCPLNCAGLEEDGVVDEDIGNCSIWEHLNIKWIED